MLRLGMQVEIPFVPAARRNPGETVEDSIVVVGHARQKKRKRTVKTIHEGPLSSRSSADVAFSDIHQAKNSGPGALEESFDFSGVPNILDDNPDLEDTKKPKKQKKQKHGNLQLGSHILTLLMISGLLQVALSMAISLLLPKPTVNSKPGINPTHLNSAPVCK